MRSLYIDGEAGAAGDMLLAALIDLGIDPATLAQTLRPFIPTEFELSVEAVAVNGIAAKRLHVRVEETSRHRSLADVMALLEQGDLPASIKECSAAIFRRLAAAEATIHSTTPDRVRFHEVGGNDALIDVIGAVWSLAELRIERIYCSPLVLGSGVGKSAHGAIHYPAPAVLEILRDQPVQVVTGLGETTTPTAAAILAEMAEFTTHILIIPERIGYGAGTHVFPDRPNLVRATVGSVEGGYETDVLWLATSDIDNTRPEVFDWLAERLRAAGAVDVTMTDVAMKKNRRGQRVEALCMASQRAAVAEAILNETGSLGVRWMPVWRTKLRREIMSVDTPWGAIHVKVAYTASGPRGIPEYDDCRKAAARTGEPLWKIIGTVERLFAEAPTRAEHETRE